MTSTQLPPPGPAASSGSRIVKRLRAPLVQVQLLLLVGLVVFAAVKLTSNGTFTVGPAKSYPAALADIVPYDGRSPRVGVTAQQRVLVKLPRPALGELPDIARMTPQRQRSYVRSLRHEGEALQSALGARGVRLREVVNFSRVWNGFAATIDSEHLSELVSLGVRPEPIRRFYPATSEAVPSPVAVPVPSAKAGAGSGRGSSGPTVALLDTGVEFNHPQLASSLVRGEDLLSKGMDPVAGHDPRNHLRRETSGTALAAVVAQSGERVLPVRIAGFQLAADLNSPQIFTTTDRLLMGLERIVDLNRDGSTDDHVRIALIGVNAPYAGFAESAEATAIDAATRLGTLVIAAAGSEGATKAGAGTVGSPAGAKSAVSVGAVASPNAIVRTVLKVGKVKIDGAALLGGELPSTEKVKLASPVSSVDPKALAKADLRGRVAVVAAGNNPTEQAASAAAAGARVVILVDQRSARKLPSMPSGRVEAAVIGVTGEGAAALLRMKAGASVAIGQPVRSAQVDRKSLESPFSSKGPTLGGLQKPDILAPGAAVTVGHRSAVVVGGTAVAAAHIAAQAAVIARAKPNASALQLRAELVGRSVSARASVSDRKGSKRAGGGVKREGSRALSMSRLTFIPGSKGRVGGVKFTVGKFERGDPLRGSALMVAIERLDLELIGSDGTVAYRLTPPGGTRELLPGEYGYRLHSKLKTTLKAGMYRFRVSARAPSAKSTVRRTSKPFQL